MSPGSPPVRLAAPGPPRRGPVLIVDRPGSVQGSIRLGGPAVDRSDPAYPTLAAATAVFGGYFASRLWANLRERRGYTYSPSTGVVQRPSASHLVVGADVATEVVGPALLETRYELGRMAESLVEAFPPGEGRVLLPRAAVARDVLVEGLEAKGWQVTRADAYRTLPAEPSPSALAEARKADAITLTSSSTVTNYLQVAGPDSVPPVVVCIGPVTAATARDAGLGVDVVADEHTIDGLVQAVIDALR